MLNFFFLLFFLLFFTILSSPLLNLWGKKKTVEGGICFGEKLLMLKNEPGMHIA